MKGLLSGIGCVGALMALFSVSLNASQLPIRTFTTRDGLPRNYASCVVTGAGGMMWLCTTDGLVRFDGSHFRVFGEDQGLPSNDVVDLVPDGAGGYWVVTRQGICRLRSSALIGQPCRLIQPVPLHGELIAQTLTVRENGEVWVASTSAVYRLSDDGKTLSLVLDWPDPTFEIHCLNEDASGGFLIGTIRGLFAWRPGGQTRDLTAGAARNVYAAYILRAGKDEIWIAMGSGVYRLLENRIEPCGPSRGTAYLVRRRDGSVWAAGSNIWRVATHGACAFDPSEDYSEAEGLPAAVGTLGEDPQGNLWGSTLGYGVFRIANSGFRIYASREGLGIGRVGELMEDRAGNLHAFASSAAAGGWLHVRDGKKFVDLPIRGPFAPSWGWNQVGLQAHDGEWWFATQEGLRRYPAVAERDLARTPARNIYRDLASPYNADVFRVFEDSQGNIWSSWNAMHGPGLARWKRADGSFQVFGIEHPGLADSPATTFREAPGGDLWIGFSRFVARFREGRFQFFDFPAGIDPEYVRDMIFDRAGRLWIATHLAGVLRWDRPGEAESKFVHYTTREGLSANSTRSLVEDNRGYIYVGCTRNVDRIDPAAPAEARYVRHLNSAMGLPDSDNSVAFRDRIGHLWFGTLSGLAEFDPNHESSAPRPSVYLTRVRVRGVDAPLPWEGARSLALVLPSDLNQVEIEWVGPDLGETESLRYQYRLDGVDDRWSEPSDRLSVNYATLPAGRARFQVRAVTASFAENGERAVTPAELILDVAAPLWRRGWFISFAALAVSAIATALYRYRIRQLLALERLRTRIASDLHDDIGSNLTQISILGAVAERTGSGSEALADIAAISRRMAEEMNDIVWAVNPRHDRLEDLVYRMRRFAGDTLGGAGIDLAFETFGLTDAVHVPLEARRPLYLVFKEAVNNVARHSHASRAVVRFGLEDGALRLNVEDDGLGFDQSAAPRGNGLRNIALRMKAIGGTAVWDSAPGRGARFRAVLPLKKRRLWWSPRQRRS